jgi:3-phosphoshikimate 1-carboxyvinyltransferase
MRAFGANAEQVGEGVWRVSPAGYRAPRGAGAFAIEPDASAATYLWAAERLTGGAIDLGVEAAAFTQPDAAAYALIDTWPRMPAVIDGSQMQDAVPTLAVMAAFNETTVRFVGVANLRVKECDRLRALSAELCKLKPGLAAEEGDDLVVLGDPSLIGRRVPVQVETYADHRIAMSLALAGLLVEGVTILDPGCTAKTWPGYWDVLAGLGVALRFR